MFLVFVPYVKAQLEKTRCLDIVWDIYSISQIAKRNNMTEEREGNQETGDAYHCTTKALEGPCAC